MDLTIDVSARVTTRHVPDRDGTVIGSGDVELLLAHGRRCRSQDPPLVTFPAAHAPVLLAHRRTSILAILHRGVFLFA